VTPRSPYEGVEDPKRFQDQRAVDRYRRSLLERTAPQADFLARRLAPDARVLEVGCGNGRLLLALALRQRLDRGVGLDLAKSRIAFARRWAQDEKRSELEFEPADIMRYELPDGGFSVAACITGTFAYFEAETPESGEALARKLHQSLEPGGLLCMELYPHPRNHRLLDAGHGEIRIWEELPADDPWRFYLSRLSIDEESRILTHEKTFIHRDTGEVDRGRCEHLYLYTEQALRTLLTEAGFREIRLHEGWADRPYEGGESMVVTATRGREGGGA
jgi:SAM-dependent methyltransferase